MHWGKKVTKFGLVAFSIPACMGAANPAFAQSADTVMDALWRCQPAFFEVLQNNKAVFGAATVTPRDDRYPRPGKPNAMRVEGFEATFAAPVQAYGLHVTGYGHFVLSHDGKPSTYWWGFRVSETPEETAKIVTTHAKEAEFRQQGEAFGWVQEVEPKWRKIGGTAIEHKEPWRMLLIQPAGKEDKPGSLMQCGVYHSKMGKMKALPAGSTLFAMQAQQ